MAEFGRRLGKRLTAKEDDGVAPYLLDEWEAVAGEIHWVANWNAEHIVPVYEEKSEVA